MNLKRDLADAVAADARLFILQELQEQTDGRLSAMVLKRVLDLRAIRRDSDWIVTQLRKLDDLGAIDLSMAGDLPVATITSAGRNHVEQRSVLEGVTRPWEVS